MGGREERFGGGHVPGEASSDRDDLGICRIGAVLATFGAEKGKETFGVGPKWVPIRCRLQPSGSA